MGKHLVVDSRIFSYWSLIILTVTVMNLFEGMVQIKIDGAQCDDFLPVDVICVVGVRVYLSRQARHDDDDSLASSVFVGREQCCMLFAQNCEILRK